MTPKEKAKELEAEFLKEIPMDLHLKVPQRWELRHEVAKKCALICVEKYLEHLEETRDSVCHMGKSIAYWRDVQDELKTTKKP